VTKPASLSVAILLCALSTSAAPQRGFPTPPEPMNPANAKTVSQETNLPRHIDLAELQREADELARTAETIPSDVASVRHGTLPKDIIQKLKQIEKLSKHLRSELNP
jgi:hypothetical protein